MGNTATVEASPDAEIVTVDTATTGPAPAQDTLLSRLERMPQLQQAARDKGGEDQMWRDLASYSQVLAEQLQMDPQLILRMLNVYKDFVTNRIGDVDKLVTEVLEESSRRQQILDSIPAAVKRLTMMQSQMEVLDERLAKCKIAIQAAQKIVHTNHNNLETNTKS